jgi:hypothetical protein
MYVLYKYSMTSISKYLAIQLTPLSANISMYRLYELSTPDVYTRSNVTAPAHSAGQRYLAPVMLGAIGGAMLLGFCFAARKLCRIRQ